jgi:hypothetical protein
MFRSFFSNKRLVSFINKGGVFLNHYQISCVYILFPFTAENFYHKAVCYGNIKNNIEFIQDSNHVFTINLVSFGGWFRNRI